MDNLDALIEMLIQEKGGTKKQYLSLMNKIAHHESKGNPTIKQMGGGPGRGLFQFEEGQHAGGKTAARRTIRYFKENNIPIPKWLKETQLSDSVDASKLTPQQQQILFLGNMRGHPTADFSKVWNNEESVEDFWAKYHWAGLPKDEYDRRQSFKESLDNYQEETISKAFRPKPLKESLANTKQIDNSRVNLPNYKYNTLNIPQSNTFDKLQKVNNSLTNQFNLGGYLNNLTSQKEFNSFNEGGLHETNPYGGIPQGMGNNGKINTVEEDETSYVFKDKGKYIFSDRIKLDGSGFEQNSQGFTNGGSLEGNCGGPGQPPCKEIEMSNKIPESEIQKSKDFILDYLDSPKYKERKRNLEYKSPWHVKTERYGDYYDGLREQDEEIAEKRFNDLNSKVKNNVKTSEIEYIDENERGFIDELYRKYKGKRDLHTGSYYNKSENYGQIHYDQTLSSESGNESLVAHELSHNVDKDNPMEVGLQKKVLDRVKNAKSHHDLDPEETKADIYGVRYLMKKYKIQDAGKEDFTKDTLKEIKVKLKQDGTFQRLQRLYTDEDIIWLMNNIALNNKNTDKYKGLA